MPTFAHLLLLLLVHSSSCNHQPFAQGDLITQTCKKTPNYDLCISTLRSDPESVNADIKGFACIMVDDILVKSTDTLDFIHKLLNETADPRMLKALAYCAQLYIPLVKYSIPEAINAFSRNQFGFVNYSIAYVNKEAHACSRKLMPASSLAESNMLVQNLSSVGVAIIILLLKSS